MQYSLLEQGAHGQRKEFAKPVSTSILISSLTPLPSGLLNGSNAPLFVVNGLDDTVFPIGKFLFLPSSLPSENRQALIK